MRRPKACGKHGCYREAVVLPGNEWNAMTFICTRPWVSILLRQPFGSQKPRKVELRGLSPFSQIAGIPPACLNIWVSEKPLVRTWWRTQSGAQAVAKFRCAWKGKWGAPWTKLHLRPSYPSCPQISPSQNNTSNVPGRLPTAPSCHAAS